MLKKLDHLLTLALVLMYGVGQLAQFIKSRGIFPDIDAATKPKSDAEAAVALAMHLATQYGLLVHIILKLALAARSKSRKLQADFEAERRTLDARIQELQEDQARLLNATKQSQQNMTARARQIIHQDREVMHWSLQPSISMARSVLKQLKVQYRPSNDERQFINQFTAIVTSILTFLGSIQRQVGKRWTKNAVVGRTVFASAHSKFTKRSKAAPYLPVRGLANIRRGLQQANRRAMSYAANPDAKYKNAMNKGLTGEAQTVKALQNLQQQEDKRAMLSLQKKLAGMQKSMNRLKSELGVALVKSDAYNLARKQTNQLKRKLEVANWKLKSLQTQYNHFKTLAFREKYDLQQMANHIRISEHGIKNLIAETRAMKNQQTK